MDRKSDAKDFENGNINIESNSGSTSYLQAADAAVLYNSYLIYSSESGLQCHLQKCLDKD
jgi:hypothetical protein